MPAISSEGIVRYAGSNLRKWFNVDDGGVKENRGVNNKANIPR